MVDVKAVCAALNLPYTEKAELYSSELQNTLNRKNKCASCAKQGADTVDCYYPTASLDGDIYRVSYGMCPRAKTYLRQQKINKLLTNSGISALFRERTFGSFNPSASTLTAYTTCKDFVKDYKPKTKGLRLWGEYGCGKTHLAAAIVNNLLKKGIPCMFVVVPELLDYMRQGMNDESKALMAMQIIDAAKTTDVLILDDLGAEKPSEWVKEQLFILINSRYENRLTTLITTNLNTMGLVDRLGQRIGSRIAEMTTPVSFKNAPDYRFNIARAM